MEYKTTVLVTGGTGFVARQDMLQLSQKGYRVGTTVRHLASKTECNQGRKHSDICLELGFESLPHFFCCLQKEFEIVPTSLKMKNKD